MRRRSVPLMRRGSVSMLRPGAWMALGALWAFGCREATSPFVSVDRPSTEVTGPLQLTFSGLDERAPVWLGPTRWPTWPRASCHSRRARAF